MYIAGYIVTGFVVAGAYAVGRLRGRWGRYERTALAIPLTIAALAAPVQVLVGDWAARDVAEQQPIKLAAFEGLRARRPAGAPDAHPRLVHRRRGQVRDRDPEAAVAARLPRPERAACKGSTRCRGRQRPPVNVVRFAFQTMVGIGTLLALLGVSCSVVRSRRRAAARVARGSTARVALAGPLSVVALIAGWVDDRGRAPAVGRLPRDADLARRSPAPAGSRSATPTLALVYLGVAVRRRVDPAAAGARAADRGGRTDRCRLLRRSRWSSCSLGLVLYVVLGGRRLRRRLLAARWPAAASAASAIRDHAHDAMAPVWEANHVWLIFVLTVMWTAYPAAFGSIASTLCVPLFIAGARDHRARRRLRAARRHRRACASSGRSTRVFALSSILTPFALGAAIGGIAAGRVPSATQPAT